MFVGSFQKTLALCHHRLWVRSWSMEQIQKQKESASLRWLFHSSLCTSSKRQKQKLAQIISDMLNIVKLLCQIMLANYTQWHILWSESQQMWPNCNFDTTITRKCLWSILWGRMHSLAFPKKILTWMQINQGVFTLPWRQFLHYTVSDHPLERSSSGKKTYDL